MKINNRFIQELWFLFSGTAKGLIPPFNTFEKLEKHGKAYIQKNPDACGPRRSLAGLYLDFGKFDAAKKEFLAIIKLGCMTDGAQRNFGQTLYWLKDYQGSIDMLATIIDKYPKDRKSNYALGFSYYKLKKYDKAIIYLERTVEAGDRRYDTYGCLGFSYVELNEIEKGKAAYKKALSINPESVEVKKIWLLYT